MRRGGAADWGGGADWAVSSIQVSHYQFGPLHSNQFRIGMRGQHTQLLPWIRTILEIYRSLEGATYTSPVQKILNGGWGDYSTKEF